jgi:hypothetical protein
MTMRGACVAPLPLADVWHVARRHASIGKNVTGNCAMRPDAGPNHARARIDAHATRKQEKET